MSDGRSALTVRDEIDLKQANSELYWFMHTEGQVVVEDDHTAYILQDGKQLKLQFVTDAAESELSVMAAEKLPTSVQFEESENVGVQKIALKLKASGKVNITVKMSLVGEEASNIAPETTAIENWTTAGDDTVRPSATGCAQRLLGISVNGDALKNFKPEIFHYTYSLAKDEAVANVTVQANTKTEILSHTMLNGHEMKEIRVYDSAKSSRRYTTYTIEIEPYSPYSPSQYSRYEVVGVQASSYQTDIGNIPEYSYDGDMSTRWSAEGVEEWLVHDLGEIKEIDAFGVAEWMGNQRKFYFDLQISDDGVNWTTVVVDYATSGTSEDIEIIPLDTSVKARYVRYWGKGNSRNSWNNVIELATYARRKHTTTQPSPEPNPNPNPGITTPDETPKPGEETATPAPNETPATSGSSSTPGTSQGGSSANTAKSAKSDTVTIPRTADDSISPSALLAVMLVSFTAMACVVHVRRKNHK